MKHASALFSVLALGLTACDTMTGPITSGDFDPLRPPGSNLTTTAATGVVFTAGQFVRAAMDNTAFFKTRPKGDMDADKLISRGTSMKVISHSDSYVKVELDSGEIGFVPTVMLEDPNAVLTAPAFNPNEFQVYPPLGGDGMTLPLVTPTEQPPEGSIPTVIEPDAPAVTDPFPTPPLDPATQPAPEPAPGPAPLPPNGEEEEAGAPAGS